MTSLSLSLSPTTAGAVFHGSYPPSLTRRRERESDDDDDDDDIRESQREGGQNGP